MTIINRLLYYVENKLIVNIHSEGPGIGRGLIMVISHLKHLTSMRYQNLMFWCQETHPHRYQTQELHVQVDIIQVAFMWMDMLA